MPETITYDDDSNMTGVLPDNRKTANLGGLGQAHQAPGNLEDLISASGKGTAPTTRVINAVQKVDPDSDRVDGMTYARIVPGAKGE